MSSEENTFSENYLILKPEDATLADVFMCVLSSGSNKIKKLIDCPNGKEESYTNFKARLSISVSVLVQKFFLAVASTPVPISEDDHSDNKIKPKKAPKKKDADGMRPKINCRDWQIMDVDDNFKYYGALTMMASKLAYEDYSFLSTVVKGCWMMKLLLESECYSFWNDYLKNYTTHAFMFEATSKDPDVTVIAFRGTNAFHAHDWMVDFNFSWYEIEGVGCIHSGFMQALGLQKATGWPKYISSGPEPEHKFAYYTLRLKLREISNTNPNARFIFTGHSLGGALAILFVTLLAHHEESNILDKIQAVYTYGQPRVGDKKFAQFMVNIVKNHRFKYYRYVYSFDMVPRLPFNSAFFNYKHFGGCVYFDSFYNGKFLKEHPNRNYFAINWCIPKYLCAWWELIRSLIVTPIRKGMDHFEGSVTILLRLCGLLIPGISAHICPNYVNLTRWGVIQALSDRDRDRDPEETPTHAHYIEAD